MMKIRHFAIMAILSAAALPCGAFTLFGSKEDALKDRLRAGDKLMQKAETAFEEGKLSRAGDYYDRAIRKYEALKETDPDFMEGIASIRLAYCAKQYTNVLEAAAAANAAGEQGTGNGEEGRDAPAKDESHISEVESPGSDAAAPDTKPPSLPVPDTKPEPPTLQPSNSSTNVAAQPTPPPRPAYDPRNFPHDFAEARMLMEDGNLSEAAAVLIPMLRHDPSNRQVRLLLAIVRTRQSRYDEAIVALEDLRGIREDMPILLSLAGAYMGAARYHDALLTLDRAVKLNPADPNPYLNLAWLTLVMPQEPDTLKNAEIYYRQAVKRGAVRDRTLETRIGLTKW